MDTQKMIRWDAEMNPDGTVTVYAIFPHRVESAVIKPGEAAKIPGIRNTKPEVAKVSSKDPVFDNGIQIDPRTGKPASKSAMKYKTPKGKWVGYVQAKKLGII